MNSTNIRPLLGLLGVLVAAMSADFNEFVSQTASWTSGYGRPTADIPEAIEGAATGHMSRHERSSWFSSCFARG